MLRAWVSIARRLESLRQPGTLIRAAEEAGDIRCPSPSSQHDSAARASSVTSQLASLPPLAPALLALPQLSTSALSAERSATSADYANVLPVRSLASGNSPATSRRQPPVWMGLATASCSVRGLDPRSSQTSLHFTRTYASSSSKGAASKGSGAKGAKPKGAAGTSSDGGGGTAADAAPAARARTPEWARLPSQSEGLHELFRRRKAQLLKHQALLQEEARKLESQGWSAAAKHAQVAAAVAALPIAPADDGKAELADAVAPGTPFEATLETMANLIRLGVVLAVDPDLTQLLRKAASAEHLKAALALLRLNHLAQAATRLGSHEAQHDRLHEVLVQECQRLGSAAPLVELWDSLYEHGMQPSGAAASAAVRAALTLSDGPSAAALLGLTSQYTTQPLAAAEAPAVLKLLEAGDAEGAAKLRQALPRLGM